MVESPDRLDDLPPGRVVCRYHGRDFTTGEMRLLRQSIARRPARHRAQLSREFCERIGWRRPDGGLKDMAARVAMLAMHRDGWIVLPPPRRRLYPPKPANPQLSQPPPLPPPHRAQGRTTAEPDTDFRPRPQSQRLLERQHRRPPLPRLRPACRRPDALHRLRPSRQSPRPARLRCRRLATGAPRPLHRLVAPDPTTPPRPYRQQLPPARAALGPYAQPRLPSVQAPRPTTATRLARPLPHQPGVDRNPSSKHSASPEPSTKPPVGSTSVPRRAADARTSNDNTPCQKNTSG